MHRGSLCGGICSLFGATRRFNVDNASIVQSLPLNIDGPTNLGNKNLVPMQPEEKSIFNASKTLSYEGDKSDLFLTTLEDDVLGPDTPGMRPLIPRFKRVQEDICNYKDKADFSLSDNSKRAKLHQSSNVSKMILDEDSETISKFEWLHPSRIRDANGRRQGDPLYDKRTLYIPPDALRKMSASQRQYWDVKSQYMDVVLFFKVVSLCSANLFYLISENLY